MNEKEQKAWREGYDLGVRSTLDKNNEALKIGEAILNVLDNRYQFRENEY